MLGSRSRRRRRGGRTLTRVALAVAVVLFAVATGLPGAASTVGTVSRTAAVDAVDDGRAAHELNLTTALEEGRTNCLVTVTNRLGRSVTVTVALGADSTDLGTLRTDGASGDTVQFSLADGASQTVDVDVAAGTNGSTASFVVNAEGSGLSVTDVNRDAPIRQDAATDCR